MKTLFAIPIFAFCLAVHGQMLQAVVGGGSFSAAATPTFSPAAGAVSNPTTVTASSASGCSSSMYFDASNPPVTQQTTYSVTTGVTLYAQVRGCPGYGNSAVASAAYTTSALNTTQVFMGGGYGITSSTTAYCSFHNLITAGVCNASPAGQYMAWPASGTLIGYRVQQITTEQSGESVTYCVYRNGACLADTSKTLTYPSQDTGQITISDATSPITTGNGMLDCIKVVTGAEFAAVTFVVTLEWQPTTPGQTVVFGNAQASNAASDVSFAGPSANVSTESQATVSMPVAGTLSNLYVYRDTTPGAGSVVFTGRTNLGAGTTPPSVTINSTTCSSAPCVVSDTTNAMLVAAGDLNDLSQVIGTAPTAATNTAWGAVFTPSVSGQFVLAMARSNTSMATGTLYEPTFGRAPATTQAGAV